MNLGINSIKMWRSELELEKHLIEIDAVRSPLPEVRAGI